MNELYEKLKDVQSFFLNNDKVNWLLKLFKLQKNVNLKLHKRKLKI